MNFLLTSLVDQTSQKNIHARKVTIIYYVCTYYLFELVKYTNSRATTNDFTRTSIIYKMIYYYVDKNIFFLYIFVLFLYKKILNVLKEKTLIRYIDT